LKTTVSETDHLEQPHPPILFVRPKQAFWVERKWDGFAAATPQAFAEGCYVGTWLFDASGRVWPILEATLVDENPTVLDRVLPWRTCTVKLLLGGSVQRGFEEVVDHLCGILSDPNYEYYPVYGLAPDLAQSRLKTARSALEVIEAAELSG
jgi:hypothetical protein